MRRELEHAKSVRREDHDNAKISEPEDAIVPVQSNIDAFPEDQREAALSVDNEAIKELVEDARRSDWENNRKDFRNETASFPTQNVDQLQMLMNLR